MSLVSSIRVFRGVGAQYAACANPVLHDCRSWSRAGFGAGYGSFRRCRRGLDLALCGTWRGCQGRDF